MRIRLSIDEEFRQIAPPISKAEHDELERSLIAEGWPGLQAGSIRLCQSEEVRQDPHPV